MKSEDELLLESAEKNCEAFILKINSIFGGNMEKAVGAALPNLNDLQKMKQALLAVLFLNVDQLFVCQA